MGQVHRSEVARRASALLTRPLLVAFRPGGGASGAGGPATPDLRRSGLRAHPAEYAAAWNEDLRERGTSPCRQRVHGGAGSRSATDSCDRRAGEEGRDRRVVASRAGHGCSHQRVDQHSSGGLRWRPGLKTRPEVRGVPLTTSARTILGQRQAQRSEDPEAVGSWLVFTSPRGMLPDPDNMASAVRRSLDRAGTVRTLRRTVENLLISAGTDPRLIECVMVHASVAAHKAYSNRDLDLAEVLYGLEGNAHMQAE